jgi:hypothetical protein
VNGDRTGALTSKSKTSGSERGAVKRIVALSCRVVSMICGVSSVVSHCRTVERRRPATETG